MNAARPVIGVAGPGWSTALAALSPADEPAHGAHVVAASESSRIDWLVCYGDAQVGTSSDLPVSRRLIVITEPPGVLVYRPAFLAQFGTALSPFPLPGFTGRLIASQPAIPWFYGCRFGPGREASWQLDAEQLLAMPAPAKVNIVTAVLSRKTMTPLHVARLRCAEALSKAFPEAVRLYGSGFEPIDDKREAIDPARFHLAMENTRHPHYWTEKFADALLGWSLPIYDGAPNIGAYFRPDAYRALDVTDIAGAIRIVGRLLEADAAAFDRAALAEARESLIREHALPALLKRTISAIGEATCVRLSRPETVLPNGAFTLKRRVGRWLAGEFRR